VRATPNTKPGPVRRPRQRHSATLAGCASGTVPQFEWTKSRGPVNRFSSGRVMEIERYVFRPEAIGLAAMFRLSAIERAGWTYVQSEYVEAAKATALPGAEFELLWIDEGGDPELA
jgi:hypothetical protein